MKPGTKDLVKFKKLKRRLGLTKDREVGGLLDAMWNWAGKQCPRGDIGRFDNEEIAIALEWDDDPDGLVAALVDCKWLDWHEEHRLVIHDWHEHAPRWVKEVNRRGGKTWASVVARRETVDAHRAPMCAQRAQENAVSDEMRTDRVPIEARCGNDAAANRHSSSSSSSSSKKKKEEPPYSPPEGDGGLFLPDGPEEPPKPKRPRKTRPASDEPLPFDSPEFASAWEDWTSFRGKLKPTTVAYQFAKFREWGEVKSIAAIRNSITNGWRGLFPPNEPPAGTFASERAKAEQANQEQARLGRENWELAKAKVQAEKQARAKT